MTIAEDEFRRVMGHFATGVTVVTTFAQTGELHGLTANSVTSVSLKPPLVLVCVDRKAESYPCFEQSGRFTINILSTGQEELSRHFATTGGGDKFAGVSYRLGANGAPILNGALSYLECRVVKVYDGGDHTIYLGEVDQAETSDVAPLVFYRGGYRQLGD